MTKLHLFIPLVALLLAPCIRGKAQVMQEKTGSFTKYTVFNAGDDQVNSYRIPSLLTAKDGSLLAFCEARRESWKDKSRTDIVMKRSTDGGKHWTIMQDLTRGTSGAYMDPTPVLDFVSGKIFLFTTFWPADDHSGMANRAILITSDDNGVTWRQPQDVIAFLIPAGYRIGGFGPGAGLQMKGEPYKHRLILPARVIHATSKKACDSAIYSDDQGKTWTLGRGGDTDDEFQIAESPDGILIYNARAPYARKVAGSTDGGASWSDSRIEKALPGVSKGCQGSVLGKGNALYYSGIRGIGETGSFDERAGLALYKSEDSGKTWNEGLSLFDKASGYSCLSFLPDGRMAVLFETADTYGFTRKSLPGTTPPQRPAGWIRLDLLIIPASDL